MIKVRCLTMARVMYQAPNVRGVNSSFAFFYFQLIVGTCQFWLKLDVVKKLSVLLLLLYIASGPREMIFRATFMLMQSHLNFMEVV